MTSLRTTQLLFLAALAAPSLSSLAARPGVAHAQTQQLDPAGEQAMLARINAMRASQGRAPLIRHPALDAAARVHSTDMAAQQELTHVSDSSGTPADRVRAAGVEASTVSENVALHRSALEAHEALTGSDAHRSNMLSEDVTHIGLAALTTSQGVYVTQVFAGITPAADRVAAAPAAPPAAPPVPSTPQLVAPSTEQNEVAAAQPAPPQPAPPQSAPPQPAPPQSAPPQSARAPSPQPTLAVQPGTNGTVVVAREGEDVVAYWVYGNGRWWYYPYPEGAAPGQRLEVDRSVQGPPPGFPAHPQGGSTARVQSAMPAPQVQPAPGTRVLIRPFAGNVQVAPGTSFYAVPPPPLVGPPTRAWRRAYRRWERNRRRWQRMHRHAL